MAKNVAYFEDTSGSSNKFYLMVEDTGNATFTATWGAIGTVGSSKVYPMSKWNSVFNTRIRHGYVNMTQAYLAGQTKTKPSQPKNNGKKYNITGIRQTITVNGLPVNVYRIESTCDFETVEGAEVLAGDMGGWVENAYNISQEGKRGSITAPLCLALAVLKATDWLLMMPFVKELSLAMRSFAVMPKSKERLSVWIIALSATMRLLRNELRFVIL